jgi:hypothetical protein
LCGIQVISPRPIFASHRAHALSRKATYNEAEHVVLLMYSHGNAPIFICAVLTPSSVFFSSRCSRAFVRSCVVQTSGEHGIPSMHTVYYSPVLTSYAISCSFVFARERANIIPSHALSVLKVNRAEVLRRIISLSWFSVLCTTLFSTNVGFVSCLGETSLYIHCFSSLTTS